MGSSRPSSNKIINYGKQKVTLSKQNMRATACPKGKLKYNFFSPVIDQHKIYSTTLGPEFKR